MRVRRIELREYGEPREEPLSLEEGLALADTGFVDVQHVAGTRHWRLRGTSKVGSLRVGGIEVHVAPKVEVARLVFLLTYSPRGLTWDDQLVEVQKAPDLLEALADVYGRLTERALLQGLIQGYRMVEESLAVVRGRIRESHQMRRHYGLPLPIEVTYDDFTPDTPENRLLRAAVIRLLRLPGLSKPVRRRLTRLDLKLADVTPPTRGVPLEPWHPTRLNARYQPALRLAEVVMKSSSFEPGADGLEIDGFVVDMAKVFEDFVCASLGVALRRRTGGTRTQVVKHLDVGGRITMKPDLVWFDDADDPLAVVDAKYKAEKNDAFPNADLYQVFAYATALELNAAHLVYARGNEDAQVHDVVHAGIRLHAHALDLTLPPSELLRQVDQLADEISHDAGLLRTGAA